MSNLLDHAKREFADLKTEMPDSVVIEFEEQILDLIEAFGASGQSGGSAPFVSDCIIGTIRKLMSYQPLTQPLDRPQDWVDQSDKSSFPIWQHKKHSGLFKDGEGKITYISGIIWTWKDDKALHTMSTNVGGIGNVPIKSLPMTLKTFGVPVERIPTKDPDKWQFKLIDNPELREAAAYYGIDLTGKFATEEPATGAVTREPT